MPVHILKIPTAGFNPTIAQLSCEALVASGKGRMCCSRRQEKAGQIQASSVGS